jgi:hypothetical protein
MRNDLSFSVFNVRISDAIEKRVFSCERVKREKIFTGDMSRDGVAEVGSDRDGAFVELIPQRAFGELIHCGNHNRAQDQHYAGKNSADLPFEA